MNITCIRLEMFGSIDSDRNEPSVTVVFVQSEISCCPAKFLLQFWRPRLRLRVVAGCFGLVSGRIEKEMGAGKRE